MKLEEEFSFKSEFKVETFNLCCLFWKTFEEYDQKIKNEQFNYSYFEFIIFQLNIYIQQHNSSHHELYRTPSNETNEQKITLLNSNLQAKKEENLNFNFQFSTGNFGNLNYFEKSSIFSVVSMVYGDKNNNTKQDEKIIINFGSLEYPLPLISQNSPKNSPNNSMEFKFNINNNNNNSSSNLKEEVFQFDEKISPVKAPIKSKTLPLPSFRVIDDDDENNDDEDEEDDDDNDHSICKSENNDNKNNNNNNIIIIKLDSKELTEKQISEKEDIAQRMHMFQMAKQQVRFIFFFFFNN